MKPEDINIACAEIIGYMKYSQVLNYPTSWGYGSGILVYPKWILSKVKLESDDYVEGWIGNGRYGHRHDLDFYNSLDACHKLIPFINDWAKWGDIAQDVCRHHIVGYITSGYHSDLRKLTALCNMTPQEKTEIFLKLHGRWIE